MGAPWSWVHMGHGRLGCGCVSVGGAYQLWVESLLAVGVHHAWVGGCRVHACSSFMVAGRCRLCRMVIHGRGVVLVPGHCRLGVVCGCWVLLVVLGVAHWHWWALGIARGCWWALGVVGVGRLLWALGIVRGHWVVCRMWVGAPSCAVHLVLPRAIIVGRDVVVGRGVFVGRGVVVGRGVFVGLEVVVACCRGPGSQLV